MLKFIEQCNLVLPDGAADSTGCMGFCAHCAPVSTMSANDWKRKLP